MKKISKNNQFLIKASGLANRFSAIKAEVERIYDPMKIFSSKSWITPLEGKSKDQLIKEFKDEYTKTFGTDKLGIQVEENKQVFYAIPGEKAPYMMSASMYNTYLANFKDYVENLPSQISALKHLKIELEDLRKNAHERKPHLFKSGNLKKSIDELVNINEVERLIIESEFILNKHIIQNCPRPGS